MSTTAPVKNQDQVWLSPAECNLEDFRRQVEQETDPADYRFATSVTRNVPVYDSRELSADEITPEQRREVQAEIARALLTGPGIAVFKAAFDADVVDQATDVFTAMIKKQHDDGVQSGDHFAKPGANDRVWGAQQKLAEHEPEVYAKYYANEIISLASSAWLGPAYQVTSDINVVNPGGAAQSPHRDYHLGFMSPERAAEYPAHAHRLSPMMTLQGAVAHGDMPVESGPTMYLPYSQRYEPGYLAFQLPEFQEYFAENYVQLPLEKGDAVFFNPALFHGAGHNKSTNVRMANLLQVSSAFGRALGSVNREKIANAIYPALLRLSEAGKHRQVENVIAASAEGYAFPTNLDRDQPTSGLAAQTQAELLAQAVQERMSPAQLAEELHAQTVRHQAA